jgi:hypothetical protein
MQALGRMTRKVFLIWAMVFLALSVARVGAFSLLGPYASWMDQTLAYRQPDDIGGPMDINEEYRWNVPVVTYAFDRSFLDYFGSNGVAAVEQAISIINDLPPASSMELTNYPLWSRYYNFQAGYQYQYDLATATLGLLVEQMGLAEPTRYVFTMRKFDWTFFFPSGFRLFTGEATWPPGTIPEYILERCFDPETLTSTHWVNGEPFSAYLNVFGVPYSRSDYADAVEIPLDVPENSLRFIPVAGAGWWPGVYCRGLTQDDVGGLRYLLASNNVNFEVLLPDVHGIGTNAGDFVNGASRPGIEKLTFMRQDYDSALGRATPLTNEFTDTYFTNGVAMHQQLQRVIAQPDFLFCATNTGEHYPWVPMYVRTGTTNWWNSAPYLGTTNNGPGVIRPQVRVTFNKSFSSVGTSDAYLNTYPGLFAWASFDGTTNAPVAYPCPTVLPDTPMRVRLHLLAGGLPERYRANYEWQLSRTLGGQEALQSSTNLSDWVSCAVVTNQGMPVEWSHQYGSGPSRFFRVVPQ